VDASAKAGETLAAVVTDDEPGSKGHYPRIHRASAVSVTREEATS
jgi:hypothetical protein